MANDTVLPIDPRGVRWRHLLTMADNTDRWKSHAVPGSRLDTPGR